MTDHSTEEARLLHRPIPGWIDTARCVRCAELVARHPSRAQRVRVRARAFFRSGETDV